MDSLMIAFNFCIRQSDSVLCKIINNILAFFLARTIKLVKIGQVSALYAFRLGQVLLYTHNKYIKR